MVATARLDTFAAPAAEKAVSAYLTRVQQLNQSSARKFFLAYRDVDWDAPEHAINPCDPGFCLGTHHALGASAWYQSLPVERRARLGLEIAAQTLKYGIAFEAGLSRGLLEFVYTLPNGSAEFRYAMHELVEESQHSMMFQEFINRSGTDPVGIPPSMAFVNRQIARCGEIFPEFFFFCVLAGEVFIDYDNRQNLARGEALHPLLRRVLQIHVTEEARHVHFAELFLRERMPHLPPLRRAFIRRVLPRVLRDAQAMMLQPTGRTAKRHAIPRAVIAEYYGPGSAHRARVEQIAQPVFALLGDVDARGSAREQNTDARVWPLT